MKFFLRGRLFKSQGHRINKTCKLKKADLHCRMLATIQTATHSQTLIEREGLQNKVSLFCVWNMRLEKNVF
jgi:hypothetical protein